MKKGRYLLNIQHWHFVTACLAVYDIVAIAISYFLALLLRFDLKYDYIPKVYLRLFYKTILVYILFSIIVFIAFKLYRSIWRFASYDELKRVIIATLITGGTYVAVTLVLHVRMPILYYAVGIVLQFIATLGIRFAYRFILLLKGRNSDSRGKVKRVMIIGAGSAGRMILRDVRVSKKINEEVCCIIDDNPNKINRLIDGVKVYGNRDCILEACKKFEIDKIYIAIPSASLKNRKAILNICKETGCELKNLPGMYQVMNGQVSISQMKDVALEDLLGRDTIKVEMGEIFEYLGGKTILVTGGGGSIGSELCRQIAAHSPKQLIIFDVYENNAYEIQLELKKKYPNLNLETLIGSVRDSRKIYQVFEKYRPQVVFHAAAHKHVPLMEDSPCEAIKNNAIGTYKTAFAAMANGCEKFVLISTDKAVNPTNIMGASKRMCEMIIQAFDYKIKEGKADEIPQLFTHLMKDKKRSAQVAEMLKSTKTEFVAVRFGNVLGSNGSVIPLFKRQIAAGGPVTVTHPDIIRYFMTIPEAVSLVLQASTYANGGEIFVLDMGEPVKIDTMARNLIKLAGYRPDVDIMIEYTGLRPGEKLFEEKLMAEEGLKKTKNDLIHIGCPIAFDIEGFLDQLGNLMESAYKNKENMRELVQNMVSTYHPE